MILWPLYLSSVNYTVRCKLFNKMYVFLKRVLILCYLVILCNTASESKTNEDATATIDQIKKEVRRFIPVLKIINKDDGDVYARFSKITKNEDGGEDDGNIQIDRIELSSFQDSVNSTDDNSQIDQSVLDVIFTLAKLYNATAVASSEKFARDGSLTSRELYVEDVTIEFANGSTKVLYKNIAEHVQHEDEKALDEYINLMKGYELPVEVHRQTYNKEGELEKDDFSKYEPKKVKIVNTTMPLDMQLLCAEVLKRSFLIKHDTAERLLLVSKFLGLKFPLYRWKGEVGEPTVSITNTTVLMKAAWDGESYSITGKSRFG